MFLVARRNVSTGAVTFAYGGEWELSKRAAMKAVFGVDFTISHAIGDVAVISIDSEGAFLATLGDFGCAMHEDVLEALVDNLSDRAVCFASKLRELGVDPEALYGAYKKETKE